MNRSPTPNQLAVQGNLVAEARLRNGGNSPLSPSIALVPAFRGFPLSLASGAASASVASNRVSYSRPLTLRVPLNSGVLWRWRRLSFSCCRLSRLPGAPRTAVFFPHHRGAQLHGEVDTIPLRERPHHKSSARSRPKQGAGGRRSHGRRGSDAIRCLRCRPIQGATPDRLVAKRFLEFLPSTHPVEPSAHPLSGTLTSGVLIRGSTVKRRT